MRILHTVPDLGWAGREERLIETALWQAEHGHELVIAAPQGNYMHKRGIASGLTVVDFPIHPNTRAIKSLYEIIAKYKIDLVDTHGRRDTAAAAQAMLSIPTVHTHHCLLKDEDLTDEQRRLWRRLDHVIAVAHALEQELNDNCLLDPVCISVVDEWVLPAFFVSTDQQIMEHTCSQIGIDTKRPTIAFVGMLRQEKGLETLLQAAARVCKDIPDLQLLVIGGGPYDASALNSSSVNSSTLDPFATASSKTNHELRILQLRAQELGLSKSLITTGYRTDVHVLMQCANLLIVPSLKEAQSRVIPQAFAAGLPVIGSNIGGIPELITNGETGWLVEINDSSALAARIISCLKQTASQNMIASNARIFAQEKLDLDSRMEKTLAAYELACQHHTESKRIFRGFDNTHKSTPEKVLNPFAGLHIMLVSAHPDDETIGAGASISSMMRLTLVHVTDGAESEKRAIAKGFSSRSDYASARQVELRNSMDIAQVDVIFINLALRDQSAAFHIGELAASLKKIMLETKPDIILTHAFEGAHPDHDSTVCAVHLAHRQLDAPIPLFEMTGYHNFGGKEVYGEFIPHSYTKPIKLMLSPEARASKVKMLNAFASQSKTIDCFPISSESFRKAPYYDFAERPHGGQLYYERNRFNMTWTVWRALARRASVAFNKGSRTNLHEHKLFALMINAHHATVGLRTVPSKAKHFKQRVIRKLNKVVRIALDDLASTNKNIPLDDAMNASLERIIDKIRAAAIDPVPADNLFVENLFEPSLYAEMLQRLPCDDDFDDIEHPDAVLPDGKITRKLLDLSNATINRLNPEDRDFWRRMKAILTSEELLTAILQKFSITLKERFGNKVPAMTIVPVFYRDYPGYRIGIHPDADYKIATVQFYLPADNEQLHLGTTFHIREAAEFREHKTNVFKPNSAYAFVRTNNSWHSVKQLGPHEKTRNTLALTVYIKGEQYQSKKRYK